MVSAEFFDIFGFIGFGMLLFSGMKIMNSKDKNIKKYGILIILISTIGLLVDGFIVIKTYILGG